MKGNRSNGATLQVHYNFSAIQHHLQALNHRLIDLLGDDYAIELDDPHNFVHEGKPFIRFENRCVYYSHNDKHFDKNPSGWVGVSPTDGQIISGCWVCRRPQIIKHQGEYQPAPTLLTLSRNDPHLLKVLVTFGCKEVVIKVKEKEKPAVAFPVTYADGSEGFHYRVALEGKDKWLHKEGGKAGEAVFALHRKGIQQGIQKKRMVVVTESPVDAATLNAAGFPAIAVLGKGNADALACDLHRETLLNLLGDDGVVYVWVEPDAADFAQQVANALQRPVKVISPPVPEEDPKALKDAYRLWLVCEKDWVRFKAEIDRLIANATEIAPQPEPVQVTEPQTQTNGEEIEIPETVFLRLSDIKVSEVQWLIKDYLPIGAVTLLAGAGGEGKSTILCDLVAAIVKGGKWLNKFEVPQGGVILILTEGETEIKRRLVECYGVDEDNDPVLIITPTKQKKRFNALKTVEALPSWLKRAKELLGGIPIRLVALDCLRGFGIEEIKASRKKEDTLPTAREIYEKLTEFANEEGSAVIVIHHFKKLNRDERRELYPKSKKGKEVAPNIDIDLLRDLIAGTADIVNAARHTLVVVADKKACVGYIVPVKSNRSDVLGLPICYDFFGDTLKFRGFLDENETAVETAIAFLRRVLTKANGVIYSSDLVEMARKEGINYITLCRARDRIGAETKKVFVNGKQCWVTYLPSMVENPNNLLVYLTNNKPEPTRADPQPNEPNPANNLKHGNLENYTPKAQQNKAFPEFSSEEGLGNLEIFNPDRADERDFKISLPKPDDNSDENSESPINTGVSRRRFQDFKVSDIVETRPEGDLLAAQPEPDRPEPDPLATEAPPAIEPDQPEPEGDLNEEELWGWFTPERLKPSARADQRERPEPSEIPTEPERPVSDPLATKALPDPLGSPPDNEPKIEFMRINSISANEPESDPQEAPPAKPDLPANEPEVSPPDQPFATLNEPVCPICGIELEPDPESGLAACLGCGRLFQIEIPPTSPDDDGDETPPTSPDDGDGGSPPKAPSNGHDGSRQIGFTPPKDFAIPPAFQPKRIYADKLNSPAILNRITVRQSDGSIKLVWQDKKKKTKTVTVAPKELDCWQPIEEIPEISLPDIESVKIPPTVVLDLETTDLDPQQGRILAAGLALYVEGKEVETQIFYNEGDEAALIAQTFDWLRETCDDLGEFILTGYNVFDFDLTYLIERARKLKVACPFRFIKDDNGKPMRWRVAATEGTLKRDPIDYNAILVDRDQPIRVVDTQHLVCRWDYTAKQLIHYDLKSVAEHFTVNIPDRPILSPAQIVHAFKHDPAKFKAYLLADLRETYALFAKLIPPYVGVAVLTQLPLEKVAVKSTAWVWQQILERYYAQTPQADEKRKYEGGLVVSRKGLWSPCLKLDIASLYPTIMLAYRIHSRKDTDQVALRWLKTLTQQRLALKAKAKAGDPNAQILQEAMKILLNSLYGFYGTGSYGFNDMTAAERVTAIGRKVLTCMIAAIEDAGGIIVEADTDGIIVCYRNADPQKILQAVSEAIPPVFKVEVEWLEATVFVSDDKNYVVIDRNGDLIAVKGSKWRGRDKEAYLTQAIPTFVRIWATEGKEAALNYALRVLGEIRSGNGWRWVVRTHRVGKGDKFLIDAGFKVGEIATYAYKDRKRKIVAKSETEGYDCGYYAKEFCDLVKEVIAAIDPAQIAAWERMVGREARPPILLFPLRACRG
jgi:DNA polymerase III epsilon subunit-like protein